MTIYTYTTKPRENMPVGTRIEARVHALSSGYSIGDFRAHGDVSGWTLMPRVYRTLSSLLAAVERRGYSVDTASCGI
jgi:hypothetical protein